jgi:hypothetical protein
VEKELRHLRERFGGQTTLSTGGLTGQTSFAGAMTDEDWEAWKDGVIERLAEHFTAEAEAADLVNAFFSQNAGRVCGCLSCSRSGMMWWRRILRIWVLQI